MQDSNINQDILIISNVVIFEEDIVYKEDSYSKKDDNKINLFLELAYNGLEDSSYSTESNLVNTSDFKDRYRKLSFGNGATWCRMDSPFSKKYKYVTRKANGELNFSWHFNDVEYDKAKNEFDLIQKEKKKGNTVTHIKIYGKNIPSFESSTRDIRSDIREHFKNSLCIVCGNSKIEIDHKNGLYNDSRVLNIKTQCIEDFQPLCRHCNQQKRQSMIITKQNKKRYKATNIPQLKLFGIDFIKGNDDYDYNDIDAMVGTYWHDPIEFMDYIKNCMDIKISISVNQ
jgi:5-methylcytosine-specific restriction endonuclease McrA